MKKFIYSLLILTAFITQSCDTEVPPTDTDPPSFSFYISGDGFNHTFTQDDDFESFTLYIKNNTTYNFSFIGADPGGLIMMEWNIEPKNLVELLEPIEEPWIIAPNIFSETLYIRWRDIDASDAQTGQILTGNFRCPVEIQNQEAYHLNFRFHAGDAGGQSGPSNTVHRSLKIIITNQDTAIVGNVI